MVRLPLVSVVFVPGLGLDERSCAATMEALDQSCSVIRLPGYGMPARGVPDVSPEVLARRLVSELDSKGIPSATLVGHSASCQVVAEVAKQNPERVTGLVLIGPTTDPATRSWRHLAARWLATVRWEDPGMGPSLTRQYTQTGLGSMLRCMDAARSHDILTALAANTRPLLVIRGQHDAISSATWVSQVADAGRGGARTLPAGAHMVVWTHGPLVAGAMREALG